MLCLYPATACCSPILSLFLQRSLFIPFICSICTYFCFHSLDHSMDFMVHCKCRHREREKKRNESRIAFDVFTFSSEFRLLHLFHISRRFLFSALLWRSKREAERENTKRKYEPKNNGWGFVVLLLLSSFSFCHFSHFTPSMFSAVCTAYRKKSGQKFRHFFYRHG